MKKTLLMVIASALVSNSVLANMAELSKRLLPLTQNEYYKTKLESETTPEFLRVLNLKCTRYTLVSYEGGSHIGVLFIAPEDGTDQSFEFGSVSSAASKLELPFLNDDEVLLTSPTGGTGEHHMMGIFMTLGKDASKLTGHFPLAGESNQGGMSLPEDINEKGGEISFSYETTGIQRLNGFIVISGRFTTTFKNVSVKDQVKILKKLKLKKNKESYTMRLAPDRSLTIQGAEGVRDKLSTFQKAFS